MIIYHTKRLLALLSATALAGCAVIDHHASPKGEAVVVAVNEQGEPCSVSIQVGEETLSYLSIPDTPRKRGLCKKVKLGQRVPIITDPIMGIIRTWIGSRSAANTLTQRGQIPRLLALTKLSYLEEALHTSSTLFSP